LDSVDRAIRNALAKGDASDPAFREKVYRSVFAALEKAITANESITDETAGRRRKALADRIRMIEGQFLDAQASAGDDSEIRSEKPEDIGEPEDLVNREAPEIELAESDGSNTATSPEIALETDEPELAGNRRDGDRRERPRRKRRPFTWFFVIALLVATIGMGVWWTHESGILLTQSERDTSVPNPPSTLSAEDYRPDNTEPPMRQSQGQNRNWINVFNPDDPTTVSALAGATAEITGEGEDKVLRIRSTTAENAVVFDVGAGVLQELAGKTAVFDIVASSEENKPAEISVRCEFGKLGNCIRKRYNVGLTPSEYLFEVKLADLTPDKAGSIEIVSDVNGKGLAIDIREIRVAAEK
jgi:hypothetical protein